MNDQYEYKSKIFSLSLEFKYMGNNTNNPIFNELYIFVFRASYIRSSNEKNY